MHAEQDAADALEQAPVQYFFTLEACTATHGQHLGRLPSSPPSHDRSGSVFQPPGRSSTGCGCARLDAGTSAPDHCRTRPGLRVPAGTSRAAWPMRVMQQARTASWHTAQVCRKQDMHSTTAICVYACHSICAQQPQRTCHTNVCKRGNQQHGLPRTGPIAVILVWAFHHDCCCHCKGRAGVALDWELMLQADKQRAHSFTPRTLHKQARSSVNQSIAAELRLHRIRRAGTGVYSKMLSYLHHLEATWRHFQVIMLLHPSSQLGRCC